MRTEPPKTVGDYVTLQRGTTYSGKLVGAPGPALLGLGSIEPGGGFRSGKFKTFGGECPENLMLYPGDIYVALKGATKDGSMIGSIARVPITVSSGRLTQDTAKLKFKGPNPDIAKHIYWTLRTPQYRQYCGGRATGSAAVGLSRDDFLAYPIPPMTPASRQRAHLLETIETKIELNRRMNETLEAMARAIFKSWFVDFDPVRAKMEGRQPAGMSPELAALFPDSFEDSELGEIPKGWEAGIVTDVQADTKNATGAGPFGSKLSRKHYAEEGVPVIRGANMADGPDWFREDAFVFVPNSYAEALRSSWAMRGDVLFTQRGTLGQVGLIPSDSNFSLYIISQSQMKLTCAPWMPPEYIFLYFSRLTVVDYIKGNAVAAGVPHINLGFLRNFPLLIPSRESLSAFSFLVAPLLDRMRANQRESSSLLLMRDALLPRLLSGLLKDEIATEGVEP